MTAKSMARGFLTVWATAALACAASAGDAPSSVPGDPKPEAPAEVREVPTADVTAVNWQARVDAQAARLQSEHPGSDVRIVVESLASGSSTRLAGYGDTAGRAPTGSTLKPITVFAALKLGLDPAMTLDCAGAVTLGEASVRDYTDHGSLTVTEVIARSSNVGIARIAEQVDATALYEGAGELVPLPPRAELDAASAVLTVIGHGVTLSLEELVAGYRTVATDSTHGPTMMKMLRAAVGPDGTGTGGWVEGVTRGGKTGTAAHDGKHDALFVGLADVGGQSVIVGVAVAGLPTTESGGGVAAPAFARLVEETSASD